MTQPPFPFPSLEALRGLLGQLPVPPQWLLDEGRQRLVLLLNHVLQQEPVACERLRRQVGKVVLVRWGDWVLPLQATPAGLLALAADDMAADLTLTVQASSPFTLVRGALAGDKPAVAIEGDVQLAADVAWLVDNVRWDLEEDLSRWLGDAPAHALVQAGGTCVRTVRAALGPWLQRGPLGADPGATAAPAHKADAA